ncbi:MAG: ABC transporter permease, partial [Rhodospirillales bacterium]|nr:ABC transporter permease [Rhodospirillales bacterium]
MFARIHVMLMKEFLELWRDPWAMFRLVVPLLIQMLVFGYAATFTVHNVAMAVLDLDRSQASREVISRFAATGRFDIVDTARRQRDITDDIDSSRAVIAVVIHAGFARMLAGGQAAPLQVIVDGTNSNTALIALGYVGNIVAQYQSDGVAAAWPARAGAARPT